METEGPAIFDWLLREGVDVYGVPVVASLVSAAYFLCSKSEAPIFQRIVTSMHGATIALLYLVALVVDATRCSHPQRGFPFTLAIMLSVALIVIALLRYPGRKHLHWLQIPNLVCLVWTAFMGRMMITGCYIEL